MSIRDEHDMSNLPKAATFIKKKSSDKGDKKSSKTSLLDWIGNRRKGGKKESKDGEE